MADGRQLKRPPPVPRTSGGPWYHLYSAALCGPRGAVAGAPAGKTLADSRATFGCWCRGGVTATAPPSLDGPDLPTPPGRRRACYCLVLVYERRPGRSSGYSSLRRFTEQRSIGRP